MPSEAIHATLDADTIIVNAKVITVDATFSLAHSVAIKDGKIVGVGDEAGIRLFARRKSRVLDAQGKTAVPALIDTHAHVEAAGLLKYTVSFDGVRSTRSTPL
jgi:predicted amidohydrolase YtcJ